MKKIVIDSRLTGWKNAGIGRYIENIAGELIKLQSVRKYFYIREIMSDISHYSLEEQLKMPKVLRKEKPDLVHFPHFNVPLFYNKPFVVTIHDLLWHEQVGFEVTTQSKWKYLIKYLGYRLVMRHAVLRAKAVIVPSNWVKGQLLKRYPEVKEKIWVIYEGVENEYWVDGKRTRHNMEDSIGILKKLDLKKNEYLIYTGSLYPHKNIKIILEALLEFPDLKLVIASARGVFRQRLRREVKMRGLKDRVILPGFVSDRDLVDLYQGALAFVFPSKSEGFGLPGLEAMAAGCPVISSNAGALPEVYDGAAYYFEPNNVGGLRELIKKVKDSWSKRNELIRLGHRQAKKYSWEKCAKETLMIYKKVIED